jgi:O-antigen/teichoic acid export membrane protein
LTTTETSAEIHGVPSTQGTVRDLARSGVLAGIIKLASAGLSLLMFFVVALVTDERQFGLYGAAYAGASLASFFNTLGQQSAVIRFWPEHASAGNYRTAHSFMARSLGVAATGALVSTVLVGAIGLIPWFHDDTPEWLPLCFASALLALTMGWSEVTSAAMRAKGTVLAGLVPRDIVWRILVIGAIGIVWATHVDLSAAVVVTLSAVLLLLAVAPQSYEIVRATLIAERVPLTALQLAEFRSVTKGLWGVNAVPPALAQVSTLLIAGILGPETAGAVFVAERATRVVALALHGINQAFAPEVSGAYHRGDIKFVRRLAHLTSLSSGIVAMLVFLVYLAFGKQVLGLFEPAYATDTLHATLLIFCAGTMISSSLGPVEILMQLTGGQHRLLRILSIVQPIGLLMTGVLAFLFGPIGAAAAISGTLVAWVGLGALSLDRHIDINPTLFGFFREARAPR